METFIPELNLNISISFDHFLFNLIQDAIKELESYRNKQSKNLSQYKALIQRVENLSYNIG